MTKVTIRYAGLDIYEWRANGKSEWNTITLQQIEPTKQHKLIKSMCKSGAYLCFDYHHLDSTTLILKVSNTKGEVE